MPERGSTCQRTRFVIYNQSITTSHSGCPPERRYALGYKDPEWIQRRSRKVQIWPMKRIATRAGLYPIESKSYASVPGSRSKGSEQVLAEN
jgi:hypothetical protein